MNCTLRKLECLLSVGKKVTQTQSKIVLEADSLAYHYRNIMTDDKVLTVDQSFIANWVDKHFKDLTICPHKESVVSKQFHVQ